MILNSPENRKAVTEFLEALKEDKFIDDFVIPFFSSHGFYLYRAADHGPGEHGKDLIFYRHIPIFYDSEYIVVQAKSKKLTTHNVENFSSQIKRALNVPFNPKSGGGGELKAHYAIFINSKRHSNDADFEFHKMVADFPHIKILSQENVCELILKSGIGPKRLIKTLSKSTQADSSKEDQLVFETILGNIPAEIDNLLDHKLKFIKDSISLRTKKLVIDYIYDRWQLDRSWAATVKPMAWLDTYFDFMTEKQYKYLIDVLEELTSTHPSFEALPHTRSVVRKITPEILSTIAEPFILFCAKMMLSPRSDNKNLIINKLKKLKSAKTIKCKRLIVMMNKIIDYDEYDFYDFEQSEATRKEIQAFAYPELAEKQKERRKRLNRTSKSSGRKKPRR